MWNHLNLKSSLVALLSFSTITVTNASLVQANPLVAQNQDQELENTVTPVNQTESLLSIEGGQNLMDEAQEAIGNEDYDTAAQKL